MRCIEWPMSWGLIFPPGLEPDRWCIPVCVLRVPLYVYYLYFSGTVRNSRNKMTRRNGSRLVSENR